ncbi:hypothetical protein F5148DRAFT_1208293 [Russula earlei]|uniref:Uncharacterized protein n=1 Tax=Russula earlei TaxID=71964 RepID=A0ACC0U6N8_9AGAM|nr:hypothetical protein F5148DRAFT_1208293 [Russula earlei]
METSRGFQGRRSKTGSKGDAASKTLVVMQTGWFVMQCVARVVQGLPVTELELAGHGCLRDPQFGDLRYISCGGTSP